MGLFNQKDQNNIVSNSNLKQTFPNFFNWMDESSVFLKSEVSVNDSQLIEFKMPIMTFGKIMGHNYIGIENTNGKFFIYMNSISRKGTKINGKKIQIFKDESPDSYNQLINNLSTFLMTETNYLKITIGEI